MQLRVGQPREASDSQLELRLGISLVGFLAHKVHSIEDAVAAGGARIRADEASEDFSDAAAGVRFSGRGFGAHV